MKAGDLLRVLAGTAIAIALVGGGITAPAAASSAAASPRIINGDDVDPSAYPFLVSLLLSEKLASSNPFQAQFCGGTLTTPTTVVTAAHCVVDQKTGDVRAPDDIRIGFGANLRDPGLRIVRVLTVTPNPAYTRRTAESDVAVLTLEQPVTDVPVLRPVSPDEAAALTAVGSVVEAIGWGNTSTSGKTFPDVFRLGRLVVFPDATCGGGSDYTYNGVDFSGFDSGDANAKVMLCAAGVTPAGAVIDSCQGDSGGPLIGGSGSRLVGIVSWGEDCASTFPGVYTRVAAMYDFLNQQGAIPAAATAAPPAPALAAAPRSGGLLIGFTAADATPVTAFAASAVDPATGQVWTCTTAPASGGRTGACTIAGLTNGTTYQVTGIAGNAIGNSTVAGPLAATPVPVPTAGRILKVSALGKGSVALRVSASQDNGSPITVNRIVCTPLGGGAARRSDVTGSRVVVSGLKASRYTCVLHVENAYGASDSAPRRVKVSR